MSFEEIYSAHHVMVYNLALQYVQNIEDAQEITQDVFVKVYENLNSFRKHSNLKTWIYRIAIHQSLDFIKSKKAKKRSFLFSMFSIQDARFIIEPLNFNHPGVELENKENYQRIFNAINQLGDQQRTAIILLKIEGRSQAETAEIMSITTKALDSLYQRAKSNLASLLNNQL